MSRSILLAAGVLMAMTPALGAAGPEPAPLTGEWSGPQVRLSLIETGGRLDLACAAAAFDTPIRPDAAGKFSTTARYEAFGGGPTPADVPPRFETVRLTGHVEGDTLQLSIDRAKGVAPEAYTLQRGRRGKIIRCG